MVSVLEGGYNLRGGGLVSTFSRSVAAHVRALTEPHSLAWDPAEAQVRFSLPMSAHLCACSAFFSGMRRGREQGPGSACAEAWIGRGACMWLLKPHGPLVCAILAHGCHQAWRLRFYA